MNPTQEVDYGKLKEKFNKFQKYNKPFIITVLVAIFVPLGIYLVLGIEGASNFFEFRLISLLVLIVSVYLSYYFYKKAEKFRLSLVEASFMRAVDTTKHLRLFVEKELEVDKTSALSYLRKLLANHDNKWRINQKVLNHSLDDFDYLMNPTVKLILTLQNAYLPVIEKGEKKEISEIVPFFEKLIDFFYRPNETLQKELFELARPAPVPKHETQQARKSLKSSTWVIHTSVLAGAVVAGIITFWLLSPLSPDSIFEPLMAALAVTFGIAGVYAAFLRK